ncbi:MAG: 23S rRNA (adenine(2503)-C(2))-methyltransferase RlmN [Opitutales bacterium]|nr:23S rRNA (adenine(2503)-C(2))-methyltransferase RlmN [Opitutales bacterium]
MARFLPQRPALPGTPPAALEEQLGGQGHPAFRVGQILDWVYRKRVRRFEDMTNLPRGLREWLEANYTLEPAREALVKRSSDVTEKLLLEMEDRALVETVLIRYPQRGVGAEESRKTICVSSQVGCAYGCRFCASGLAGWKRDLTAGEIVGQFLHVCYIEDARALTDNQGSPGRRASSDDPVPFDNVVFMGMGEPLANYEAVVAAIRCLNAPWGLGFGARRITLSTSGLVPQIRRLADEGLQIRLAVSLHGATNPVRDAIMPINRKYPLEELIPAIEDFSGKNGRLVTLEYILIEDVNDFLEQAHALAGIAARLRAHVNLIPYNSVEGLTWKRPNIKRQQTFARVLREARVSHTIRKEKGHDIDAACGQLRLRTEKDRAVAAG